MRINPVGHLKRFFKPYSRAISANYRSFRRDFNDKSPRWMRRPANKIFDYFDLFFMDHHIFRAFYANRHKIAPGVWRSAQPSPAQIEYLAKKGIRTIINLRGERDCGSYRLQVEACRKHDITLVNFIMRSRNAPTVEVIHEAKALLQTVEYPILIHCKSGADRAGLMSALVMFLKEGKPLRKAMKQLSLKYGHFKQSDTGVLDYFFERYLAHDRDQPIGFFDWLDTHYNPAELAQEYRSKGWANLIVNRALNRE